MIGEGIHEDALLNQLYQVQQNAMREFVVGIGYWLIKLSLLRGQNRVCYPRGRGNTHQSSLLSTEVACLARPHSCRLLAA